MKVKIEGPVNVDAIEIKRNYVACGLFEPPEPPAPLKMNQEDEDIIRRVFTHKLDHNDMVDWARLMYEWAKEFKICVDNLRRGN